MPRKRTKADVRCVSIYMTGELKREILSAAQSSGETPAARRMTPWICRALEYALRNEEDRVTVQRISYPTSLELPSELLRRVERRLRRTGDSLSNYVIRACQRYLLAPAVA